MAVKDIDKATSPLANLVNTFDVTPPGAAAIIIKPRASSIGSFNNKTILNATTGKRISWHKNPIVKSLGFLITLMKSLNFNPKPRPSIIKANARGAIFVTISIRLFTTMSLNFLYRNMKKQYKKFQCYLIKKLFVL